jgi:YbbR domain-containing protein
MTRKNERKTNNEKVEIAKQIASQSQKVVKTYASIEMSIMRIIRWLSSLVDRLLFNQRYAKIVALGLAVIIYASINLNTNIFEATISGSGKAINNVPVSVIANTEVYEISGLPETVTALIVGDVADIALTETQGQFKVVADLTGLAEGIHQISLIPSNFSPRLAVSVTPSTAIVTIERKTTQRFLLDYDFVNMNKMDLRYVLGVPELEVTEILVRASERTLDSIAFVKAFIDVSGVDASFTKEVPIVAYNQLGERVDAQIIPSVVRVSVNVSSPNKSVPLVVDPVGLIPNGLAISSIVMDHQAVTLYAPESVLSRISRLTLPIDATTLTQDTTLVSSIAIPSGVRQSSISKVNVEIKLVPGISQEFLQIPVSFRNNRQGFKFSPTNTADAYMNVTVFGAPDLIAQLREDDIAVYIDLFDAKLGISSMDVFVEVNNARFLGYFVLSPAKPTIEINVVE